MADNLVKHTHTDEVARFLRQAIVSGEFFAGQKLPSTREFAQRFNVSQQVIKSALVILEDKELILRKPRVGIFVNPQGIQKNKEYCLLAQRGQTTAYATKLLSISDCDVWRDVNINTRYISSNDLSSSTLSYELKKIKEQSPECLILSVDMPGLAKACCDLPFPVIFVGDVSEDAGVFENQIVEDTAERATFAVETALKEGRRNIVMLGGEGSWAKILKKAGSQAAKKSGGNFQYIMHFPGEYDNTISKILTLSQKPDALIIDGFFHIESFLSRLNKAGFTVPKDLTVIADGEVVNNAIYIKIDYTDISKDILRRIKMFCANPEKPMGRTVLKNLIKRKAIKIFA